MLSGLVMAGRRAWLPAIHESKLSTVPLVMPGLVPGIHVLRIAV